MPRYKNLGRDSGVYSYEIGNDRIIVTFSTSSTYEYTYSSAGSQHVENMKSLATNGQGLNGYINNNVKYNYSRKIR